MLDAHRRNDHGLSWPEWLKTWNYDVVNFSKSGTDLWYSYRRFQEQHERFDRIVFLVTAYHRQPIRGMTVTTVNPQHLQWWRDQSTDDRVRRSLTAARDWVLWAQDSNYCWDMAQLMLDRIQQQRPDTLIINCFKPDHEQQHQRTQGEDRGLPHGHNLVSLQDISQIDLDHWKLKCQQIELDIRHCHLNSGNNQRLAREIAQWIDQGQLPLQDISQYRAAEEPLDFCFDLKKLW